MTDWSPEKVIELIMWRELLIGELDAVKIGGDEAWPLTRRMKKEIKKAGKQLTKRGVEQRMTEDGLSYPYVWVRDGEEVRWP